MEPCELPRTTQPEKPPHFLHPPQRIALTHRPKTHHPKTQRLPRAEGVSSGIDLKQLGFLRCGALLSGENADHDLLPLPRGLLH